MSNKTEPVKEFKRWKRFLRKALINVADEFERMRTALPLSRPERTDGWVLAMSAYLFHLWRAADSATAAAWREVRSGREAANVSQIALHSNLIFGLAK